MCGILSAHLSQLVRCVIGTIVWRTYGVFIPVLKRKVDTEHKLRASGLECCCHLRNRRWTLVNFFVSRKIPTLVGQYQPTELTVCAMCRVFFPFCILHFCQLFVLSFSNFCPLIRKFSGCGNLLPIRGVTRPPRGGKPSFPLPHLLSPPSSFLSSPFPFSPSPIPPFPLPFPFPLPSLDPLPFS